ncbi:MAG: histidine kinase [Archaeoglobus sp.]|nr:MAG: histidine kinase [Archaeoglobus sp.]
MSLKKLKPGTIMEIATTDVITLPPTTTIMAATKMMRRYRFRRLPIADPGTRRLEGIITATDLVNFFGGGNKYKIIEKRFSGNLIAAINEDVREIMEKSVLSLAYTDDVEDGLELMLSRSIGGCPVVDEENRVVGIVTERDYLRYMAEKYNLQVKVSDYMTKKVITVTPTVSIADAMRIMISKKIRRLPIIEEGLLMGWLNTPTIVRYFSGEAFKVLVTGNAEDVLSQPVSTILSSTSSGYMPPLTVLPNESMSEVARKMLSRRVGCALVVSDGRLEGIITEQDMIRFLYCEVR